jgi:cytochrome P450
MPVASTGMTCRVGPESCQPARRPPEPCRARRPSLGGKAVAAGARPVFFAPSIGYYVVSRHAEIEQVFRDKDTYSAAIAHATLVLARESLPHRHAPVES